jgi:Tfp pilus assembly protein FimV
VKRKEEERALEYAEKEVNRQIAEQQRVIDDIIDQIEQTQAQMAEAQAQVRGGPNGRVSRHEVNEKINQYSAKIESLTRKKNDVDTNLLILKTFLKQISEEIQMT